jgi:ABC-type dipeptide/oligopeptide/nickel transport system permease component
LNKKAVLFVILFAIVIAILAGYFSSSFPDGLEKVTGFSGQKAFSIVTAIFGILIIYFLFRIVSANTAFLSSIAKILNNLYNKPK